MKLTDEQVRELRDKFASGALSQVRCERGGKAAEMRRLPPCGVVEHLGHDSQASEAPAAVGVLLQS